VETSAAHTAEHAFIGALQKVLGQTLKVRKVEHKKDGNTAFIVVPELDIDSVVKAEGVVNALIAEDRQVATRSYPSLEDAKKHNPSLRANEERISGEVRVVEIEGHDVAACAMDHVANLRECGLFLATRLSRSGSEYEVDFVVGNQARDAVVALSAKMMKVCEELGANPNTVENTARKARTEGDTNFKKLKMLSREKLDAVAPVSNDKVSVIKGTFSGLADEALLEFAGDMISKQQTAVILSNAGASETAYFIFARNEAMNIDCNKVFREVAGADGRGGGKPHFVTGVVKKEKARQIIDAIAENVLRLN
jgi:alanyl-tRNA synthetase